jgi:hypothetical protein
VPKYGIVNPTDSKQNVKVFVETELASTSLNDDNNNSKVYVTYYLMQRRSSKGEKCSGG